MEVRCENKKHAELSDGVLEIKCNSKFCGASSENVVIHKFDAHTGELIETVKFKEPRSTHASRRNRTPVRSA